MRRRKQKRQAQRLAQNVVYYLNRLVKRLGVTNGHVKADRHCGRIENVVVTLNGPRKKPTVKPNSNKPRRKYSPEEMQALLRLRLSRLLENCNFRFGEIAFQVFDGRVQSFEITVTVRPNEESVLKRFFCP